MSLADYNFELPEELIGQKAIEPRDSCKLMLVNRRKGLISHYVFRDLVNILDDSFVLVINDTKVFPARLFGQKETGGKIELLLLKQLGLDTFLAIARGKLSQGGKIIFPDGLEGDVKTKLENGEIEIKFNQSGVDLISAIDKIGKTPLPPYIHSIETEDNLRTQYQTVYAKEKGSAAAPTAGLHFTDKLLEDLKSKGVEIERVTLHVGLGTFKPVTKEQVESKTLHTESFWLTSEVAQRLNEAKRAGKKIIAVGTTACRVLETQTNDQGEIIPGEGETSIFIQPGYRFKSVDGLITNFHLPETSLLMLVSALANFPNSPTPFVDFSSSLIGEAYKEAIKEKYKFFSFGDAMLIL